MRLPGRFRGNGSVAGTVTDRRDGKEDCVANTKIMFCGCESDYQDKRYGIHQRVHNEGKEKSGQRIFRCTVCGKEK